MVAADGGTAGNSYYCWCFKYFGWGRHRLDYSMHRSDQRVTQAPRHLAFRDVNETLDLRTESGVGSPPRIAVGMLLHGIDQYRSARTAAPMEARAGGALRSIRPHLPALHDSDNGRRSLPVFATRDCLIDTRHQLAGQRTGVGGCHALAEFLAVLHTQHKCVDVERKRVAMR